MTQPKYQPTDPDFLRLLAQDHVVMENMPEPVVKSIRRAILNKTEITDEDLDAIPDEGTRNTMKRWNRMFS